MAIYLIKCKICDEQYIGSTKTKFRSRVNNYKSTQRKFMNKKVVLKQALKPNDLMNITVQIDIVA